MIQFNNTMRVLNEYGNIFSRTYRTKNDEAGYDPASELNNITFRVSNSGSTFELTFNLPDYWRYAENGRGPGKMPPPGSLMKWMEWKHILPSPMQLKSGKVVIPSMQSLEFLIRRKIGREGTQGSHTWELTENELKDQFIRDVKDALTKDCTEYLKQISKRK